MSEFIYANIVRAGIKVIATSIYIQVSKLEAKEAAEYQGSDPAFAYKMNTRQLPTLPIGNLTLVQQGDHVIDLQVIDPKTNTYRTWLIISDPQPKMLNMTWQWACERMRGT